MLESHFEDLVQTSAASAASRYHVDLEPSGCWDRYVTGSKLEVRRKREDRPKRSQGSDCQGNVKLALSPVSSNGEDTPQIIV